MVPDNFCSAVILLWIWILATHLDFNVQGGVFAWRAPSALLFY